MRMPENMGIISLDYVRRSAPRTSVGADYLDVLSLDADHVLLLLGDVSGHGLRPSFLASIIKMVIVQKYLRRHSTDGAGRLAPSRLLWWLNQRLCLLGPAVSDMFVSFLAVRINIRTGNAVLACAGCPSPVIFRGEFAREVDMHGLALGVDPDTDYTDSELRLETGDCMFLYTDGVTRQGTHLVNLDRASRTDWLRRTFCRAATSRGTALLRLPLDDMHVEDDMTVVRVMVP